MSSHLPYYKKIREDFEKAIAELPDNSDKIIKRNEMIEDYLLKIEHVPYRHYFERGVCKPETATANDSKKQYASSLVWSFNKLKDSKESATQGGVENSGLNRFGNGF